MAITEQQVLDTLKRIEDPSQGKDLVSLGLVDGVTVKDSNIAVLLVVPRIAARRWNLSASSPKMPCSPLMVSPAQGHRDCANRVRTQQIRQRQRQRGRKTFLLGAAVCCCCFRQGRVGKSTTAVNLAIALQARRIARRPA